MNPLTPPCPAVRRAAGAGSNPLISGLSRSFWPFKIFLDFLDLLQKSEPERLQHINFSQSIMTTQGAQHCPVLREQSRIARVLATQMAVCVCVCARARVCVCVCVCTHTHGPGLVTDNRSQAGPAQVTAVRRKMRVFRHTDVTP